MPNNLNPGLLPQGNFTGYDTLAAADAALLFKYAGQIIYEISTDTFYYWNGAIWVPMSGSGSTIRVVSQSDLPSFTLDCDTTDLATIFVNQNFTISSIDGTPTDGQRLVVDIINNDISVFAISLGASFELMQIAPSVVSPGKLMTLEFKYSLTFEKWFLFNWKEQLASEDFDGYFIIIAGQSNGTDRFTQNGNLPLGLQGSQPNSYVYYKPSDDNSNNGSWVNLSAGVNTQTGTPQTGYYGLSVGIANKIFNTYGKKAYIVPTAIGGTYIADDVNPSWSPYHINDYFKRMLEPHLHNAYIKIRSSKKLKPLLLWVHGESDADTAAHGASYETSLTSLISETRSYTGFANMPVIITKLRADYAGPPILGRSNVRQSMVNVAANMSNVFLFDTDNILYPLSSDGQHYNPIVPNFGGVQSINNLSEALADYINTNIKPINQSAYWKQGIPTNTTDSEATALINAMTSVPNNTRQTLIQNFFINYKAQADITSLTQHFGFVSFLAAHDNQAARLWWNDPSKLMTTGGVAPTFTPDAGYKNSGNGWIDTLFNTATGANFSQNNGSVFIYVRDNIASNGVDIGIINATTVVHINSRDTINLANSSLNQAGSSSSPSPNGSGLWHFRRISANYVEMFRNGCFVKGFTNVSLSPCNGNLFLLAFNDLTGTPFGFSTRQIAMAGAGSNTIDPLIFYNNVQDYMLGVGANV